MEEHKKYIVWSKGHSTYGGWHIVAETDEWDEATKAYHKELSNENTGEVIITEFIPLLIADGREMPTASLEEGVLAKTDQGIEERGIVIDEAAGVTYVDGEEIEPLTALENRLFLFLYRRNNEIVDKPSIFDFVWADDYTRTPNADTRIEKLVSRLRQKIEPDPENPRYLVSIRGRGYRFNRSARSSERSHADTRS